MSRQTIMLRQICGVALCSLLVITFGCGGPAGGDVSTTIKGKVTYQGAAVGEGTVSLVNAAGTAGGQIEIQPDGTFDITKMLPSGEYLVAVLPPEVDAPNTGNTAPRKIAKAVKNIPQVYRSSSTSNIKTQLKGGDNELNIEMK